MPIEATDAFDPRVWEELFRAARAQVHVRPSIKSRCEEPELGFATKRELWDARAAGFAHKKRGPYVAMLMERLPLEPDDTVLDFGCGPGTLAIPLAKRGHVVCGADFSPRMLEELEATAQAAGVHVETRGCSWQERWDDLPEADLVVASRSFAVDDLADAVAKLESKARKHIVATLPVGDSPWFDARLRAALGRQVVERTDGEFVALVNYLWALGRLPRVDYISFPRVWAAETEEELLEVVEQIAEPRDEREVAVLRDYVGEHLAPVEGGVWLDYDQQVHWGMVSWEPPRR